MSTESNPAAKGLNVDMDTIQARAQQVPAVTTTQIISPDKPNLRELLEGVDLPIGVKFVCKLDTATGMYLLPSHKNYFGGVRVSNIIADPVCAALLLAVADVQDLCKVFTNYPLKEYIFKIAPSVGSSGVAQVLVVRPRSDMRTFRVCLAIDRFDDNATCLIKLLRFQLTSQDCAFIASVPEYLNRFVPSDQEKITAQSKGNIPRLPVSLLGNHVLNNFEWFKSQDILFLGDITELPDNFLATLPELATAVSNAIGAPDPESREHLDMMRDYMPGINEEMFYDF